MSAFSAPFRRIFIPLSLLGSTAWLAALPAAARPAKPAFAPAPFALADFSAAALPRSLIAPAAQADYGLGQSTAPRNADRADSQYMCGPAAPAAFAQARIFAEPAIAAALTRFYQRRPQFLWITPQGQISAPARQILAAMAKAADDGLNPADYRLTLPAAGAKLAPAAAAQFELGLSAKLLRYVSDMQSGRVKPAAFGQSYDLPAKQADLEGALTYISADGEPEGALTILRPQMPQYAALQTELRALNRAAAGSGDDAAKSKANLAANGLERLRWLPQNLPAAYVFVNIPAYTAYFIKDSRIKLAMKAVVGSPAHPTTLFSAQIERVVFNPSWGVPYSIMKNEMAGKIARDPSYISRHNYEVFRNGRQVSAASVNWAEAARTGNVHIRQKPGKGNALGRLKILFPNAHDIYMHDTPAQSAFGRDSRALSHGCIRLAQPEAMAAAVLGTDEKSLARYFKRPENGVALPKPIAVYLGYFTAWPAEPNGPVRYYKDVYGLDARLAQAEQALSAARAKADADSAAAFARLNGAAAKTPPAKAADAAKPAAAAAKAPQITAQTAKADKMKAQTAKAPAPAKAANAAKMTVSAAIALAQVDSAAKTAPAEAKAAAPAADLPKSQPPAAKQRLFNRKG